MKPRNLSAEFLTVRDLTKAYGDINIFANLNLELAYGHTLAVIGASGCGKTTLLRLLAGLEAADGGTIRIQQRDVTDLSPRTRSALYLYQEPLLFPHLNVFENIAFGLRLRGLAARDIECQVRAMLGELALDGFAARQPESLSGGQRQRVAFGRALVVKPALLLLDEPFSNLDPEIRMSMQSLFKRVTRQHEITAVFVTHDLKEALSMGDSFGCLAVGRYIAYPDRASFCADPATGVQNELRFWREAGGAVAARTVAGGEESAAC